MNYHFKVHKEPSGYWAECIELQGCMTEGDSADELKKNMKEALNLYLDEPKNSQVIFPLPQKSIKRKGVVAVPVDFRVALAFCIRRLRLVCNLTQAQAARKMGFTGSLTKYQRLESSKTANPTLETLVMVKKAFPDFDLDEIAS